MEIVELKRLCLLARHKEDRIRTMKYYNETSLDDLSDFIDRTKEDLKWPTGLTGLGINDMKYAEDEMRKRYSIKSNKGKQELYQSVLLQVGFAISSYANGMLIRINEAEKI